MTCPVCERAAEVLTCQHTEREIQETLKVMGLLADYHYYWGHGVMLEDVNERIALLQVKLEQLREKDRVGQAFSLWLLGTMIGDIYMVDGVVRQDGSVLVKTVPDELEFASVASLLRKLRQSMNIYRTTWEVRWDDGQRERPDTARGGDSAGGDRRPGVARPGVGER